MGTWHCVVQSTTQSPLSSIKSDKSGSAASPVDTLTEEARDLSIFVLLFADIFMEYFKEKFHFSTLTLLAGDTNDIWPGKI